MPTLYSRWISNWEYKLATRDNNRIVRPFDWGLDWLGLPPANGSSGQALHEFVGGVLADSDRFFGFATPRDYRLDAGELTFTSPIQTPYPENNVVHAAFFPARRRDRRAVLVLPQWNADEQGHLGLCRLLNRFGITALRMNLAYHGQRKPPELERADYHVSSNLGRTIHASRQSVIDARACLDWLQQQGYERLRILGTSLGSCIAFIVAAHDRRISTGVFNHVSMYFSDVIWTGLSTGHIRKGLAGTVTADQLRHYWSVISPRRLPRPLAHPRPEELLIWARHDSTSCPCIRSRCSTIFAAAGFPMKFSRCLAATTPPASSPSTSWTVW
jgi:hypothetical protein